MAVQEPTPTVSRRERTLEASALAGGIAFAIFSLAMAVGRVTAGRLLFGLGYRTRLRISGAGSLIAGLTAAVTRSTVVAGIGFLFLGFFIASAAPAAFGMIAGTDEDPALAVAAMTTVGYSGFVVARPSWDGSPRPRVCAPPRSCSSR